MSAGRKAAVVIMSICAVFCVVMICLYVRWDMDNKDKVERQYQAAYAVDSADDTPERAGVLPLSSVRYIYAQKKLNDAAVAYARGMLMFEAENSINKGRISQESIVLYDKAVAIESALEAYFNILNKDAEGTWPYTNAMESFMETRAYVTGKINGYFETAPADLESEIVVISEYTDKIKFTDISGNIFLVFTGVVCPVFLIILVASIIYTMVSVKKG